MAGVFYALRNTLRRPLSPVNCFVKCTQGERLYPAPLNTQLGEICYKTFAMITLQLASTGALGVEGEGVGGGGGGGGKPYA